MNGKINSMKHLNGAAMAYWVWTADHTRLINRDKPNQHPIEAITGLREELDIKLGRDDATITVEENGSLIFDWLEEDEAEE